MEPDRSTIELAAASVTTQSWGSGVPEIVLLHDGLGSIGLWRDVPERIAAATGTAVLAFDRPGHGASQPVPGGSWPADWLHDQAEVLVQLLDELEIERPLLVGHSDGGSIALIAAAAGLDVRGVIALASHSYVETVCTDAISAMRQRPAPIVAGLARHHAEPAALFEAWSGVWTSEPFSSWDIRPSLEAIDVPALVVQGDADEYATDAMAWNTAAAIGPNATCRLLPGVGHLIHRDYSDAVVDAVRELRAG